MKCAQAVVAALLEQDDDVDIGQIVKSGMYRLEWHLVDKAPTGPNNE